MACSEAETTQQIFEQLDVADQLIKVEKDVENITISKNKKKKRRKNKNKDEINLNELENISIQSPKTQTDPPTIPIDELFDGTYPEGQIMDYPGDNLWRQKNNEKKMIEKLHLDVYNDIRRAAETHRQVRNFHKIRFENT
uniref:Methionine aminopeptidase 2B (Trinotate prediction) n=1 Tax=Myxobolus squamalis TaxID=59785 RepID=A0A6B2FW37_MYXSQ